MRARALISSATVEHYTPRYIWERAVETMGGIDLDPASDGHTVPATRHYTRDDDGLARPWGGRVWLNPPFGTGVVRWFQTLVDAYQAGAVTEAVVLWKAATETKGWYVLTSAASRVCFPDHRIAFLGAKGDRESNSATFSAALFYFGPHPERFAAAYASLGQVWTVPAPRPAAQTSLEVRHAHA